MADSGTGLGIVGTCAGEVFNRWHAHIPSGDGEPGCESGGEVGFVSADATKVLRRRTPYGQMNVGEKPGDSVADLRIVDADVGEVPPGK